MWIETVEFILRPWEINDAEELALIANNKKIFDNLRDAFPHPYHLENAVEFISNAQKECKSLLFAIEIAGKLAGSVAIAAKDDVYRNNAEIGYFLAEEYWGKGIMTNIVKKIVEVAFASFKITRIYAEPFAKNMGSRRVLEKAGLKLEATLKYYVIKNGEPQDSCIYSILKQDFINSRGK